jgi:hypothetical protein
VDPIAVHPHASPVPQGYSRNARLAELHAFFRYVALNEPAHALRCQRALAIPTRTPGSSAAAFPHTMTLAHQLRHAQARLI